MKAKDSVRVMQLPSRGQITIPAEFRRQLGLDEGDLLKLSLKKGKIEIEPLAVTETKPLREYTEEDIRLFLAEDQISEDTAKRVRELLAQGSI